MNQLIIQGKIHNYGRGQDLGVAAGIRPSSKTPTSHIVSECLSSFHTHWLLNSAPCRCRKAAVMAHVIELLTPTRQVGQVPGSWLQPWPLPQLLQAFGNCFSVTLKKKSSHRIIACEVYNATKCYFN